MSNVRKFASLVNRHVGIPGIVFELGARDCNETLAISQKFPLARIYCFECNQATLPICRERTADNSMITLVESAAGDRDGMTFFHPIDQHKTVTTWDDGNPGASSLFVASGKYELETYVQGTVEVPITRLDTFMARHKIPKVDALWMDIQGAELMALRGFGDRIYDVKLISLEAEFIEIYDAQPLFWEIHDFLTGKGFFLTNFLSLGRFACDAVYIRAPSNPAFARIRSRLLIHFARFATHAYFPLRKFCGNSLRRLGLR
jgi:FkbM family methyltransferase